MTVKSRLVLVADLDHERFTIIGPTSDVETVEQKIQRQQVRGRHVRCEPVPEHLDKQHAIDEYHRLHPQMNYVPSLAA